SAAPTRGAGTGRRGRTDPGSPSRRESYRLAGTRRPGAAWRPPPPAAARRERQRAPVYCLGARTPGPITLAGDHGPVPVGRRDDLPAPERRHALGPGAL